MIALYILVALIVLVVLWRFVDALIGLGEVEREFFADYFFRKVFPPLVLIALMVVLFFSFGGVR